MKQGHHPNAEFRLETHEQPFIVLPDVDSSRINVVFDTVDSDGACMFLGGAVICDSEEQAWRIEVDGEQVDRVNWCSVRGDIALRSAVEKCCEKLLNIYKHREAFAVQKRLIAEFLEKPLMPDSKA